MDRRHQVAIGLKQYEQLRWVWEELEDTQTPYYKADTAIILKRIGGRFPELRGWLLETPDEEYDYGVKYQSWMLDEPFQGEVKLHLLNDMMPGSDVITNVPRTVLHHSPCGHTWGYIGSGPHDLALDILCQFFPLREGERGVECYLGSCHPRAWELHYPFTKEVISQLDSDVGHKIPLKVILGWLKGKEVEPVRKFSG